MKEKAFKVREIDGVVVKNLTDKQAGELYKAICSYNFNNDEYSGKDPLVKSIFELMKNSFEADKFYRETGKLGGVRSAMIRKENENIGPCIARAVIGGEMVGEMIKDLFGEPQKPENKGKCACQKSATK
jgi:hypothetical protein